MISFTVKDMTCGHCIRSIIQAIHAEDQGAEVTIEQAGYTSVPVAALDAQSTAPAAIAKRGRCCG